MTQKQIKNVFSSPFVDGLARALFGLYIVLWIGLNCFPKQFDVIIVDHLPINGCDFIVYILGGGGLLLSGYIFSLFLEMVFAIVYFWIELGINTMKTSTLPAHQEGS